MIVFLSSGIYFLKDFIFLSGLCILFTIISTYYGERSCGIRRQPCECQVANTIHEVFMSRKAIFHRVPVKIQL